MPFQDAVYVDSPGAGCLVDGQNLAEKVERATVGRYRKSKVGSPVAACSKSATSWRCVLRGSRTTVGTVEITVEEHLLCGWSQGFVREITKVEDLLCFHGNSPALEPAPDDSRVALGCWGWARHLRPNRGQETGIVEGCEEATEILGPSQAIHSLQCTGVGQGLPGANLVSFFDGESTDPCVCGAPTSLMITRIVPQDDPNAVPIPARGRGEL